MNDYTPKPEGRYVGRILDAALDETDSGKSFIGIVIDVTDDTSPGISANFTREIRVFLTDAAWIHSESKLKTLGFKGDFAAPQFDESLYKTGFSVKCTHRTHDGKTYEDWDLAHWGSRKERKTVGSPKIRKLTAKWKKSNPVESTKEDSVVAISDPPSEPNREELPF